MGSLSSKSTKINEHRHNGPVLKNFVYINSSTSNLKSSNNDYSNNASSKRSNNQGKRKILRVVNRINTFLKDGVAKTVPSSFTTRRCKASITKTESIDKFCIVDKTIEQLRRVETSVSSYNDKPMLNTPTPTDTLANKSKAITFSNANLNLFNSLSNLNELNQSLASSVDYLVQLYQNTNILLPFTVKQIIFDKKAYLAIVFLEKCSSSYCDELVKYLSNIQNLNILIKLFINILEYFLSNLNDSNLLKHLNKLNENFLRRLESLNNDEFKNNTNQSVIIVDNIEFEFLIELLSIICNLTNHSKLICSMFFENSCLAILINYLNNNTLIEKCCNLMKNNNKQRFNSDTHTDKNVLNESMASNSQSGFYLLRIIIGTIHNLSQIYDIYNNIDRKNKNSYLNKIKILYKFYKHIEFNDTLRLLTIMSLANLLNDAYIDTVVSSLSVTKMSASRVTIMSQHISSGVITENISPNNSATMTPLDFDLNIIFRDLINLLNKSADIILTTSGVENELDQNDEINYLDGEIYNISNLSTVRTQLDFNELKNHYIDIQYKFNKYSVSIYTIVLNDWHLIELLDTLNCLLVNDSIKFLIFNKIKNYLQIILYNGNYIEKKFTLKLLLQLCFNKKILFNLKKNFYLIDYLNNLIKKSIPVYLKLYSFGILWLIEQNEINSNDTYAIEEDINWKTQVDDVDDENTLSASSSSENDEDIDDNDIVNLNSVNRSFNNSNDNMIYLSCSYEYKDLCSNVKNYFKLQNYNIKVYYNDVNDDSSEYHNCNKTDDASLKYFNCFYQDMFKSIENCKCFIMFVSNTYKLNPILRMVSK